MSLGGKVALVTGAAQGLGKAFSEAMLKRGARVCLADVQKEKGEVTASEFQQQYGEDRAMFVKCDVTSTTDFKNTFSALMRHFGRLDIMVNNAGVLNEENPALCININTTGMITGTNLAIDAMRKDKGGNGGVIINVASTAALTTQAYPMPVYTGSKFAVLGFTQTWAHNPYLSKMGLRFACLCPAFTNTAIMHTTVPLQEDMENIVGLIGVNKVSTVVEGFMQLVDNTDCNGAVMTVTATEGIQFYRKPKKPSQAKL